LDSRESLPRPARSIGEGGDDPPNGLDLNHAINLIVSHEIFYRFHRKAVHLSHLPFLPLPRFGANVSTQAAPD
jgi:hypothetical protein